MQADQLTMDTDEYDEILNFYRLETILLDEHRYEEWLDLLTESVQYKVPVRETRAGPTEEVRGDLHHIDDDKFQLEKRVERINTEFAWAEDSPTRTRHILFNTRTIQTDENRAQTLCNLLLCVTRRNDPTKILSGEREDVLRKVDQEWKLEDRVVRLDQTSLPVRSVSFFI